MRPTLLNSCAFAATAAEAKFRIQGGTPVPRGSRVLALDAGAAAMVDRLTARPWQGARFYTLGTSPDPAEVVLLTHEGRVVRLHEELADADMVLMIATTGEGSQAASSVGAACTVRGIMTAGLILGEPTVANAAVTALRPHARVLLVSRDEDDVVELLDAVGA